MTRIITARVPDTTVISATPVIASRRWKVAISAAVIALSDRDLVDIVAYQRRKRCEIRRTEVEQATKLPSVIIDLVFSM